jgi:hypothetical protein
MMDAAQTVRAARLKAVEWRTTSRQPLAVIKDSQSTLWRRAGRDSDHPQGATMPCCTQTLPSADWTPGRSIYKNLYVTGVVFVKALLHPLRYIHVNSSNPLY